MSGVRILGGRFRGQRVTVPAGARPTEARTREALMNRWAGRIEGSRFLDAFAGSGAMGIEALGRGATAVTWVEQQSRAVAGLRRQVRNLEGGAETRILRLRLPQAIGRLDGPFDLVFADPPYAFEQLEAVVAGLASLLDEGGELALEHAARRPPPAAPVGFERVDLRRYGDGALGFYRRARVPGAGSDLSG